MPAPLLAPAGKLQGWIFTDLLTDLGVHANLCGHCAAAAFRCADRPQRRVRRHHRRLSQIALSDTRLAWHRQACGGSAQGRPGGAGARDDDG